MEKNDDYEVISPSDSGKSMVELVTKAEIDQQISTAKQYPRSIKQFNNDLREMATLNEEVADSCNYGLPRGGKVITGASARFAEMAISAWGNARAGARVVHEDARFITAQGVAHDLQRNVMITMEVKRRITDKHGKTLNDDMIGVTGNAAASIALRNAILRMVPKAFWEPIYQASREVALGTSQPIANRRARALEIMQKFGVTPDMIFAKFEIKGVEDITIEHLELINACRNSIKDGQATAEELFAIPKPADESKGNEAVKGKLSEKAGKKKTREEEAVAAGADPKTGEFPADKKVVPDAEQRETASVKLDKKPEPKMTRAENLAPGEDPGIEEETVRVAQPVFSTAQIGVKGKPGDNTQPDFDGWRLEFMKRCNTAPSLAEIGTLYKHNAGILTQIKSRFPDTFEECERCYNDAIESLKMKETQAP